jgi:hypothetical protein
LRFHNADIALEAKYSLPQGRYRKRESWPGSLGT